MAESTKGFKVDDDLKVKINEVIEASGLTDKQWIEAATNVWILQEMKNNMPDFQKDISELELHTNRINELVVNMIQRAGFEKEDITRKFDEIKESKNLIIEQCQIEIVDLKKQVQTVNEDTERFKQMKEEAERLVRQMEEANEHNKLLIQEYKEKNDTLTGLVSDFREGFESSKSLQEQNDRLEQIIEKLKEELQDEKENSRSIEAVHKELIRQVEERHQSEIERIIEKKDVEKERELIQIRTEFQDRLQKTNEDGIAKLQTLYERIEQLRIDHEAELKKQATMYEKQISDLKKMK